MAVTVSSLTVNWSAHTHGAGTTNDNVTVCRQCTVTMVYVTGSPVKPWAESISQSGPVTPIAVDPTLQNQILNDAFNFFVSVGGTLTQSAFNALAVVSNTLNTVTNQ